MYRAHFKTLLFVLTILLFSVTALSQTNDFNLPDLGDESHQIMSPLEQKQLGEGFYRQALVYMDIVEDPILKEYLDKLGNRLFESTGLKKDSFHLFPDQGQHG